MALQDFFVACAMMDRVTASDDLAGIVQTWQEGAHFRAGIATAQTTEAKIAYQTGAKTIYTVVTEEAITLSAGDRIKRLSDGLVLKITSNAADMTTPAVSVVKFRQANAEAVTV